MLQDGKADRTRELDEVALLLDRAVLHFALELQATALSLEPPTSRRISDGAS